MLFANETKVNSMRMSVTWETEFSWMSYCLRCKMKQEKYKGHSGLPSLALRL